jgi:hypothetical protein
MPSVNDPRHKKLTDDFNQFLDSEGIIHGEFTYHDIADKALIDTLRYNDSPTSTHVRTREDRMAICLQTGFCFQYEIKTKNKSNYEDWCIEAFPLMSHYYDATHKGVWCLYIYRDEYHDIECAFWSHAMPQFRELKIPPRGLHFESYFRQWFGSIDTSCVIQRTGANSGSGDPFIIIDGSVVKTLPHWKELIFAEIRDDNPAIIINRELF